MADVSLSGTTGGKGKAQHGPDLHYNPEGIADSWLKPLRTAITDLWKKAIDASRLADRLKAENQALVKERNELRMKVEDNGRREADGA